MQKHADDKGLHSCILHTMRGTLCKNKYGIGSAVVHAHATRVASFQGLACLQSRYSSRVLRAGGTCRLGLLLRYSLFSAEYPLGALGTTLGDCCLLDCMPDIDRPRLLSGCPPLTVSRGLFGSGTSGADAPTHPYTYPQIYSVTNSHQGTHKKCLSRLPCDDMQDASLSCDSPLL